jgi:hypothetical protein
MMDGYRIILFLLALSAGLAGCSGIDGGATTTEREFNDISNQTAKERALTAESDYVSRVLSNASCLTNFDTTISPESEAQIINRSQRGIFVDVSFLYSYETDTVEADVGTLPIYRITDNRTVRVEGDSIEPC